MVGNARHWQDRTLAGQDTGRTEHWQYRILAGQGTGKIVRRRCSYSR